MPVEDVPQPVTLSAPETQQGKVKTSGSNYSIKKAGNPNIATGSSFRKGLDVALSALVCDKVMLKAPKLGTDDLGILRFGDFGGQQSTTCRKFGFSLTSCSIPAQTQTFPG